MSGTAAWPVVGLEGKQIRTESWTWLVDAGRKPRVYSRSLYVITSERDHPRGPSRTSRNATCVLVTGTRIIPFGRGTETPVRDRHARRDSPVGPRGKASAHHLHRRTPHCPPRADDPRRPAGPPADRNEGRRQPRRHSGAASAAGPARDRNRSQLTVLLRGAAMRRTDPAASPGAIIPACSSPVWLIVPHGAASGFAST